MKIKEDDLKQWLEINESLKQRHSFYLILFVYVVMNVYLHFIDLKDGSYDWSYYSLILMTFSLIWMAAITFSFPLKNKMIVKELRKNKSKRNSKN